MGQTTGGKEWQLGRQLLLWAGSADNFPFLILSGGRTTLLLCAWRTWGVLPKSYKMTSSKPTLCMFLAKLLETDAMRAAWWYPFQKRGLRLRHHAAWLAFGRERWTLALGCEQGRTGHMWQTWGSLETLCSTCCCLQHPPVWPVWQEVSDSLGRQRPPCCQRYADSCCWDETLRTIIKYAGELWVPTGAYQCLNWCGWSVSAVDVINWPVCSPESNQEPLGYRVLLHPAPHNTSGSPGADWCTNPGLGDIPKRPSIISSGTCTSTVGADAGTWRPYTTEPR